MALSVEPSALNGYANEVGRAASDAEAVRRYLDGHYEDPGPNNVLSALAGTAHNDAVDGATVATSKIRTVLGDSGRGLDAGATYYRGTDSAAASRLDAVLPGRTTCTASTNVQKRVAGAGTVASFSEASEPSARLTEVGDIEYSHPLAFLDVISISDWALKGFEAVLGVNPLEEATKFFAGDWEAVGRTGKAFGNAADAVSDLAANLQSGANALSGQWRGNAADAAFDHFTVLADGVDSLVEPMREISKHLDDIARCVWNACDAVAGLIKGMIDSAIIAGIAAAAGTVAAESVFGAVAGYGIAALAACRLLNQWDEATGTMTKTYDVARSITSAVSALGVRLQSTDLPKISEMSPYRHPYADPDTPWTATSLDPKFKIKDQAVPGQPWTVTRLDQSAATPPASRTSAQTPTGSAPSGAGQPWTVQTMPDGTTATPSPPPAPTKLFDPSDLPRVGAVNDQPPGTPG